MYKAQAARKANDISLLTQFLEAAEADARFIMEQLPGVDQLQQVYQFYAALLKKQPHYRPAADYFSKFQKQMADPFKAVELNQLIGDYYYLNRDYQNALDYYALALNIHQVSKIEVNYFSVEPAFYIWNSVDALEQLDAWAELIKLQRS